MPSSSLTSVKPSNLNPWTPLPPEVYELQALVRRLEALIQMQQQEVNRLQAGVKAASVVASISSLIEYLDQEIKTMKGLIQEHINQHPHLQSQRELLTSISGIAALTAAKLLAEIPHLASYQSARQAAAYAGLTPSQRVSGSSVRRQDSLMQNCQRQGAQSTLHACCCCLTM